MLENPTFMCIDAGGENCPCILAESGNCIACGRLSGHDCSGCRWHGVCIYNEYIQNHRKIKRNRKDFEAAVTERFRRDDTVILGLDVGKGFSVKCCPAGSYVFLRRKSSEQFFNVPISVMKADTEKGIIYLLVKCISAKTKSLLEADETLTVRGPYKNGIIGIENIFESMNKAKSEGRTGRILILCRSAGISPAVKLIGSLEKGHYVKLIADTSNLNRDIVNAVLRKSPEDFLELDFADSEDLIKIKREIAFGEYDCIAVFASDYYINLTGEMAEEAGFRGKTAVSNNFNICCGEGICGACSAAGKNGETLKLCKCRLSGEEILKRKVIFK
ncbi:MAG: hypothetical protein Q4C14_07245 [Bacillota bacterium]|nr:hypothetical protein [Bacillota bacterium]